MTTLTHHLERLRQKPDHIKKHIAFWTSLGITMVIVLFWAASVSISQTSTDTVAAVGAESPWHAISASVGDAWKSFTTSIGAASATYEAPPLEVTAGN